MAENLTHTDWPQIQARKDVLSLLDQQAVLLEAPPGQGWFRLCWHSERFTLQVTRLAGQAVTAMDKSLPSGKLTHWPYLQVDGHRPNYRMLMKLVYDSEQQGLQVLLIKDAKLRFPGSEGDVRFEFS